MCAMARSGVAIFSVMARYGAGLASLTFLFVLWQLCVWVFNPPTFLVPAPAEVLSVFFIQTDYLLENFLITLQEMVLGLMAGAIAGVIVAIILHQSRLVERFFLPVVVTTQTLPVFAIAPLLVLWFGFGMTSKVVMAGLIIFFPVTSAFFDGLRQTPREWSDLGKTWGATSLQTLRFVRIPAAFPSLSSGLRIAATIAPIGAVVGEWAGAAGGLGFVMLQANARTQTDVVFASLILLAFGAYLLRAVVVILTNRFLLPPGFSNHR